MRHHMELPLDDGGEERAAGCRGQHGHGPGARGDGVQGAEQTHRVNFSVVRERGRVKLQPQQFGGKVRGLYRGRELPGLLAHCAV